jgi:hypothetical protein
MIVVGIMSCRQSSSFVLLGDSVRSFELLGLFVWAGPGGLRHRNFVLAATGFACTLNDVLRFLSFYLLNVIAFVAPV